MNTIEFMQMIQNNNFKMRVSGFAQNARNNQPEAVAGVVTKVGQSVFYIGSKRYRPFMNQTKVLPFK